MPRQILVTSALPYANGPLHLGHIIEAVQADVWVRFQRSQGHECLYICAEDAHGTPIMIRAQSEGITPEALIERSAREHAADYAGFLIGHDQFHSTHAAESRHHTESMYARLRDAGHLRRRAVRQAYDASAGMFLPDRYVRGTCPRCGTADQYGDSCENCGATYTPAELIDPRSTLSGVAPEWRESEHIFFALAAFETMLREWLAGDGLQPAVRAKLDEWFAVGLKDWDISRDAPYFGIEVPDAPGKFFYVWFDAPIGYLGSFQALCDRLGLDFNAWLAPGSTTELHHFIGKDISYFHTLFWPAVLHGAGYRTPTAVHVHGFLTIDGQKMSKSRGTFITARSYLDRLPPEPLRYYFAAKLGPGVDDIDLGLDDFATRFNADVVGKLVNIASRCAGFVARGGGLLAPCLPQPALYEDFVDAGTGIAGLYEQRDTGAAIREIMALADRANQYVDQHKPWALARDPGRAAEVLGIATQGLNLFRVLMTYLAPVLPEMAVSAGRFLGAPLEMWSALATPLLGTPLGAFAPLATRLDAKLVATLTGPAVSPEATVTTHIAIDEFAKLDLRVAAVLEARLVDGSDKLLELRLDLGGSQRTVYSGIRTTYDPADLVGRHVLVIANLAPRKMRFGVSEGMVLCASGDGPDGGVFLVAPDAGATPGMKVN